ncbi:MAG: type II toxin-antitoxin system PemK/MazF family toxin [Rothia mucilaginosa]|uniref:Type II toxin-antitoxin system PemK/MazF family toxin n=1 Tax=Rothia mucilaginosa TaxID=43675 RepID=A0A930PT79_9MICC|nr:type II toxin-antitoxin system PemK/MazF family toxin [Rothia mucilaginosa]MBF1658383.1 type II toxin-antitoxin system PemK/MazF family toxin [Rothia mucilaginosa]
MLEILKKIFFALLPFLQKAAEDALNDATASKGGSESSQKSESRKGESRQGEARTSGSSAPKPSAPKPSASTRSASTASASAGSDYPGDYRGMIDFEYSPSLDGDADPGEIVWTWVPFEEDHSQGKDRPVLLVGRDGEYLLALMMTSKDHNNREHADSNYLDIGSGPWDPQGRASEVKLNRVIRVRPDAMRREGAIMPEDTFRLIERAWTRHNG